MGHDEQGQPGRPRRPRLEFANVFQERFNESTFIFLAEYAERLELDPMALFNDEIAPTRIFGIWNFSLDRDTFVSQPKPELALKPPFPSTLAERKGGRFLAVHDIAQNLQNVSIRPVLAAD